MTEPWRPPLLWRIGQVIARFVVWLLARLRVSGDVPAALRRGRHVTGPLILAANHISPFDPVVIAAACRLRRISPRFLATGGLFQTWFVGSVMRHWGHIPVHRGTTQATQALPDGAAALAAGSVLLVYPEGGIGLDPGLWPDRAKTGTARLALATGATVVPVAQWGAHELVPYSAPRGLLGVLPATLQRRPVVKVRFGEPVDLSDLTPRQVQQATERIMAAITATLAPLRIDEPDLPRHFDPTRPVRSRRRQSRRAPTP
jgi:1-acyl-sn-glycerol-3-phosphate acyltransferase